MSLASFVRAAEKTLEPVLDKSGSILYSSAETLQSSDLYIMGLNPGGASGPTIAQDLKALPSRKENAYIDESWDNRAGTYPPGQAPLQRRLKWVIEQLGYDLRNVCASNLIFMQSPSADGVSYPRDADLCWPVHERIIAQVRPKLLLAFGNSDISPYGYLRERFQGPEDNIPSGHGNWRVRGFRAEVAGCPVFVAGLPHLSRYSPIDKTDVVQWLNEKLET